MKNIRCAKDEDLSRIAEIEIFNYRLCFYPIFQNDAFYFGELQVLNQIEECKKHLANTWVYDDGVVKGFVRVDRQEIEKLFVEPALQGRGIGEKLLRFATDVCGANRLWALEKNERAIAFYQRHGFRRTNEKKLEEDTTEYLIRMSK